MCLFISWYLFDKTLTGLSIILYDVSVLLFLSDNDRVPVCLPVTMPSISSLWTRTYILLNCVYFTVAFNYTFSNREMF